MKKTPLSVVIALLAFAPAAHASLMLGGIVNGVVFCAADNNTGCVGTNLTDLDPAIGSIQLGAVSLGGVTVIGSTHTQTTGALDALNSQSLQIINNTGGTIGAFLAVGGIDFTAPVSSISLSGSGVWENASGSIANLTFYVDPANQQGGQLFNDTPGVQVFSMADIALGASDSFATGNISIPIGFFSPFSMTVGLQMQLVAGGTLLSRGQSMVAQPTTIVPEPASMSLLLIGAAAVGVMRQRVKQDTPV